MNNKIVFLIGSSREKGNTRNLLDHINKKHQFKVIDISKLNISYYDYQHENINDDFIKIIEEILEYESIGFVSPVYWYTVSAQMKTFIDRLSDLLSERKELGRSLSKKNTFLIATGATDEYLPKGMEETIELTSKYFNMNFRGSFYAKVKAPLKFSSKTLDSAESFINNLINIK